MAHGCIGLGLGYFNYLVFGPSRAVWALLGFPTDLPPKVGKPPTVLLTFQRLLAAKCRWRLLEGLKVIAYRLSSSILEYAISAMQAAIGLGTARDHWETRTQVPFAVHLLSAICAASTKARG